MYEHAAEQHEVTRLRACEAVALGSLAEKVCNV